MCRIDFVTGIHTCEGLVIPGTEEKVSVLFDEKTISEKEVKVLVNSGAYKKDKRIIIVDDATKNSVLEGLHPRGSDGYDCKDT